MNVAVVGCGWVADSYGKTLENYPELKLVGAYDNNKEHLESFSRRWCAKQYLSLEQALNDPFVEMVLNLTDPRSHYEVTKMSVEAGKHVYSEKPLAMETEAASELAALAKKKNVYLATAPCSVLAETAQTLWKALHEGVIGRVRVVYANFDDGMIAPKLAPWQWRNEAGVRWPAQDEFEVGCTFEHAGYMLTWLAAFFGPAKSVTAFASCQLPDKGIAVKKMAPDFTVGCIEYSGNIVARVTCGLVGPKNKSLTIIGDDGILEVPDLRNDIGPAYFQPVPLRGPMGGIVSRLNRWTKSFRTYCGMEEWRYRKRLPLVRQPRGKLVSYAKPVDFCRGPAELAAAVRENRPCRLSAELGIHIVQLVETLQYPERFCARRQINSTFAPIQPLFWGNQNQDARLHSYPLL
jgi:predicted dehydrogenase